MELENLVGKHMLSGVDYSEESLHLDYEKSWGFAGCTNFVLDGVTYTAVEDGDDGYRSHMGELLITPYVPNSFPAIEVVCSMSEDKDHDILECRDTANGKLVLEIGTDYSDSYYPCFVGNFQPENMSINEGK